ncbi:MAG TPA: DUF6010 family protein [Longimicrobiales bacterium]|nr:DUF6010 family protein [Longimicrobiales bacterium]
MPLAFRLSAAGLVVAGLIYIAFALSAGANAAVPIEAIGTFLCAAFVTAAVVRKSYIILALGWALHPAWDVLAHTGERATYAPGWYVPFCIVVDVVIAAVLIAVRPQKLS